MSKDSLAESAGFITVSRNKGEMGVLLSPLKTQMLRLARRLIWPRPVLYAPFGIIRNRGNIFSTAHDIYISGFPRSGNTFALKAFLLANPGIIVRSHKHIPAFVVQSAKWKKPGMILIRNPIDAAVSWAIFQNQSVHSTLAYYNDYYSVLLPRRDDLFFVAFDSVISDFGSVITEFNARWNTAYVRFQHTPENLARCTEEIESEHKGRDGAVDESRVPRPSIQRKSQREALLKQFNRSPAAQKELHRATELYHILSPEKFTSRKPLHKANTTQSIRLRPAM